MQPDQQRALIRRALDLVERGASEAGEPARSPVSRYLDPHRFERELERVLRRHPLAVSPSASIAPGETLALDVAGLPLLLARDREGVLRAFANACRHRGARIHPAGKAAPRALTCPYHSWTYSLDGQLRGRPHAGDFPHAPAADCSLARVAAGEALGFIWVVPRVLGAGEPATLDLETSLGRFARDLRSWGYDGWVPFHQREFPNAANWKIPFEGNLETYHFQYAHRDTIAGLFHDNLLLADHDGPHHRIVLPKRSMAALREVPEAEWDIGRHSNIIYCFFPATFVLHEGDHANVFTVLPETVGTSRVLGTTLVPEAPRTEKARAHWQKNVDSFWGALDEDFALGMSVQSTLASGANRELLFGANEWCSAKFHADVEALLGDGPAP